MPTSASWTRSAINLQMGSKTRWVGVVSGFTVLAIMIAFGPAARYVPRACLGAIIMWIAALMVDLATARYVWRWSRTDAVVLVITYVSTIVFQIQYAIYLGIVMSLVMLVRRVGELQVVEMMEVAPRIYREIEIDAADGIERARAAGSRGRSLLRSRRGARGASVADRRQRRAGDHHPHEARPRDRRHGR